MTAPDRKTAHQTMVRAQTRLHCQTPGGTPCFFVRQKDSKQRLAVDEPCACVRCAQVRPLPCLRRRLRKRRHAHTHFVKGPWQRVWPLVVDADTCTHSQLSSDDYYASDRLTTLISVWQLWASIHEYFSVLQSMRKPGRTTKPFSQTIFCLTGAAVSLQPSDGLRRQTETGRQTVWRVPWFRQPVLFAIPV